MPFGKLGQQLNLPQTVCIALRGISALPFETTRYHWCGDVIFDSSTNGLDPDGGFKTAIRVLMKEIIQDGLVAKCGHEPRDILILGFGQGGMLALNIAGELLAPTITACSRSDGHQRTSILSSPGLSVLEERCRVKQTTRKARNARLQSYFVPVKTATMSLLVP